MSQSFITPAPERALYQPAIGRRFLAFLLDFAVIGFLFWTAAFFILIFGFLTLGLGWLMFHILPWFPLLYFTAFIGGTGATPGQRMFGLTVRQFGSYLPPTLAQGFVFTLLLGVSFAFGGLPILLVLFGPEHRAAHDMLSGLAVVRQDKKAY